MALWGNVLRCRDKELETEEREGEREGCKGITSDNLGGRGREEWREGEEEWREGRREGPST